MDRNDFGKLTDNPSLISSAQWSDLCRERDQYPFCAPLQLLSLMADKANGAPLWESQSLPRVELYMLDVACVQRMFSQMEQAQVSAQSQSDAPVVAPVAAAASQSAAPAAAQPAEEASDFDILKAINDYQEVSFKTAPKSVILTNFLEKDGGITLSDESQESVPVQELAKKSIQAEGLVGTETLAVILERQGKLEKALAVYEKLLVNNPEKSSTFAPQIARLKALIESK